MWWVIDNRVWTASSYPDGLNIQKGPFDTEKQAIAWMKKHDIKPLSFKEWEEQQEQKRNRGII